ncbi:glycogen debranching protein GlgX [Enterovirga rhinocerotis]|uniref:Glycogen operon protein n=1 Tax=Enterovirga rhinocerotis TaxID=1339210 RepID=A0A4R7BYC3_9HYPH|nr:glycogen debranching protein GlgX [Enterovirga rhinocerotis]TDR89745.1 glycogen operon protein [Enterovirga rhinocerotis]
MQSRRPTDFVLTGGRPEPLGATADADGVNFALVSAHGTAVDLCLFDAHGAEHRFRLPARTGDVWHGRLEGAAPGLLYLYRVHGPWRPDEGHRFDPGRPVLDPYARLLSGPYRPGPPGRPPFPAPDAVPRGVVLGPALPEPHQRPMRPWRDTVIYEAHVRGLTKLHPAIPPAMRGTYDALGHPAIVDHLLRLGVTALELLPIQSIADEPALLARGLSNYWGYSTLNYFAPEPRYFGPAGPIGLKQSIRRLHEAGIEVILDVVLNHTAEIDEPGPVLSFRGIDNALYYKHRPGEPGRLLDVTGCGNSFDLGQPAARRLALDALRHWADEYGIDGFRFDLATTLARDDGPFDPNSAFFAELRADSVLSSLKLIAEPWDLGEDGYRLGAFPAEWSEWNDRFRDGVRGFWRGDAGQLPRLAQALSGSREIFAGRRRGPRASVNYVASHDGFTLRDLVSYAERHNEANGEGNRDGHGHNLSQNFGHEGDTEDRDIRALRARAVRNLIATLALSQGEPMLLAGDELSRSQGGNNNAYAQDNATSWLDWEAGFAHDPDLPDFVAHAVSLRRGFAALRRESFLRGEDRDGSGRRDVHWLTPRGTQLGWEDWQDSGSRCLGMQIGDDAPDGRRLLLLANAGPEAVAFRLAAEVPGGPWRPILDTTEPTGRPSETAPILDGGGTFPLAPRSLVLFQQAD